MVDINTWPPSIAIAFGLAPFVLGLSGVAINRYVACSRHFNVLLSAVKNSAWPEQQILKGGMIVQIARVNLVAGISAFLICPQFNVRRGVLNADDVRNFPPYLRRWLVTSFWLTVVGATWLLLGVCLIKLSAD